jgi:anti-sigma B factor antagonist
MKIDLRESAGVAILEVAGKLTAGDSEAMLREAVDTLVGTGRTKIVLNLSDVEFMDSAGVGEIVASYRLVERFGGKLKIAQASKKVRSSLDVAKLLPLFEVFESEKEAVASFAAS